jgi:hypothetical protein
MPNRKQTTDASAPEIGAPVRFATRDMPPLQTVQSEFARRIFDENAKTAPRFIARGKFSPDRHLQVYQNNVFASLTEALRAVYPVVQRLVGEDFFTFAAHEFIRRFPPRGGNLHDFGGEFCDFLGSFDPAVHLAYLPDTARLEWAYHQVYHAPDGTALSLESLTSISPAQYATLRFSLQPHVRFVVSDYPILKIWQVNQAGYQGDDRVDLAEGAVRVLILRRDLEINLYPLGRGEYTFLNNLHAQTTFAQACDAALAVEPDFNLTDVLQRHVRRGMIESIR